MRRFRFNENRQEKKRRKAPEKMTPLVFYQDNFKSVQIAATLSFNFPETD